MIDFLRDKAETRLSWIATRLIRHEAKWEVTWGYYTRSVSGIVTEASTNFSTLHNHGLECLISLRIQGAWPRPFSRRQLQKRSLASNGTTLDAFIAKDVTKQYNNTKRKPATSLITTKSEQIFCVHWYRGTCTGGGGRCNQSRNKVTDAEPKAMCR